MNYDQLRKIIREEIMSSLEEKSDASEKAKQMGLDYMQFGRYGKDGKVTHKSEKGKLVPISKDQAAQSTGMKFGRGAQSNTMYSPKTGRQAAKYDPSTGNMQSLSRRTPDQNRQKNVPRDSLSGSGFAHGSDLPPAGRKIIDKVHDKLISSSDELQRDFGYHEPIPINRFEKVTGISRNAAKYYSDNYNDYEKAFELDDELGAVYLNDPSDV